MHRSLSAGLLSAGMVLAGVSGASARVVERSGDTYHVAVCPQVARERARCHAHVVTDSSGAALVNGWARPKMPAGYGPSDLRSAYNVSASGSSGTIIAIVDAFGYANAECDLGGLSHHVQPAALHHGQRLLHQVQSEWQKKNYPPDNVGWAQETALDLDMASAMCPNCTIILVEGKTNSFGSLATAVDTAAGKGAHVISNSYGGGETGGASLRVPLQPCRRGGHREHRRQRLWHGLPGHLAARGGGGRHQPQPGSHRATRLDRDRLVGRRQRLQCMVFAKPAWQTDTECHMRMEADVSAVADPNTGVAVYGRPAAAAPAGWSSAAPASPRP